ncbi:MAG: DinB family protein, partial [Blastocatellia bacterium]
MNKHEVDYLFQYNRWANARMLDAASKLTVEDFTKDLKSSHRSLRDTLSHTLAAEWIWLERWKGTSPKALLNPADFPTVESVRARWASVDDDYVAFINQLADASLGT